MNTPFRILLCFFCIPEFFWACNSNTPKAETQSQSQVKIQTDSQPNHSEYKEFALKFVTHNLPYSVPAMFKASTKTELDKKFINDLLSGDFTPAFGKDDVLPRLTEDMDKSKYFAGAKLKLDSFDGFIIYKQGENDYYFLCIFDNQGKFTDGTWIAFTEGSGDDGTIREASINDDGSIEISQFDVVKGKADRAGAERHFYEVTTNGKIRDLKENATPGNA